jgi:hypothetical protein
MRFTSGYFGTLDVNAPASVGKLPPARDGENMESPGVSAVAAQSMLLAALIACLHRTGVLPIATVLEEFQEVAVAYAVKSPQSQVTEFASAQLQAMTQLAEKLGPFVQR